MTPKSVTSFPIVRPAYIVELQVWASISFSPAANENKLKEELKEAIHGKSRILVIDDEDVIRKVAEGYLTNLGYEVILAENGRSGLDLFSQEFNNIDLVILDMIMPELNGRECFLAMRKIKPNIPVILASGFSNQSDLNQLIEEGLSAFIHKPYHEIELSHLVADVLKKSKKKRNKR